MAPMIFKEISRLCKREYGQTVKEAITTWRNNGFSQQFIAGKLGVSPLTVRQWAKKFGIAFDRRRYNSSCRGGTKNKTWKCQKGVTDGLKKKTAPQSMRVKAQI